MLLILKNKIINANTPNAKPENNCLYIYTTNKCSAVYQMECLPLVGIAGSTGSALG